MVSINVCVAGATGWTGRAIAAAVHEAPDLTLRTAVSRSAAGTDLGAAWGGSPIEVPVHADVADALDGVDVLPRLHLAPSRRDDAAVRATASRPRHRRP